MTTFTLLWLALQWLHAGGAKDSCAEMAVFGRDNADCDQRHLKTIPDDLNINIKVLSFRDNELASLGMDQFKRYVQLQEIYLVRNRIEDIAPDAFRYLHNLQILDMEGNELTSIPEEAFKHLRSLRELNMKNNPIKYLTNSAFQNLPRIEKIILENCWLERIEPYAFSNLDHLNEINLVGNDLNTLSPEMRDTLPSTLSIFRLHRNLWHCDCRLRWLRELTAESNINWDFHTNTPRCEKPQLINGVNWKQLTPEQFACATRIISNSNTSLQLRVGGNVSIDCIVFGDPEPKIIWKKDGKQINKLEAVRERHVMSPNGNRQLKSTLLLTSVTAAHASDYTCIASNSAGRSEVTYKVWVESEVNPSQVITIFGINNTVIIAIAVGAVVIVLVIICCAACMFHYFSHKRRAYRTRRRKTSQDEPSEDTKEADKEKALAPQTELLITEKEVYDSKENHVEHSISSATDGEFTMRIFASYDEDENDEKNKQVRSPNKEIRDAPPDLLCDDKYTHSSHITPTPPPPPAAYFANNLVAAQKRAEENPYAKPNELKTGGSKTPDLNDEGSGEEFVQTDAKPIRVGGVTAEESPKNTSPILHSSESRPKPSRSSFKTSERPPQSVVPKEPCSNPVCLKNHSKTKTNDSPNKMSNSLSAEGLDDFNAKDVANKYKTLPNKSSLAKSSSRKLPAAPSQKHRVQFAVSPEKESPSSSRQSTPTYPNAAISGPSWATLSRGSNPLHPKGLKVMSPEGPRTLSFPGAIDPAISSPPAAVSAGPVKPSHTYGCSTSVDDLLSPPFGNSSKEAASIKRHGHKDDYGTAV